MFVGTEVRLGVSFNAAQARLVNLVRGGLLRRASDDAYRELGTGLARVGPLRHGPPGHRPTILPGPSPIHRRAIHGSVLTHAS